MNYEDAYNYLFDEMLRLFEILQRAERICHTEPPDPDSGERPLWAAPYKVDEIDEPPTNEERL